MDFELTDEQTMLREVSRSMLAVHCPPTLVRALAASTRAVDDKLWQRGTEIGWTGLGVPEDLGGSGQGLVELCLVAEELGRAVAPAPVTDSALAALALSGVPELAGIVRGIVDGELRAALATHGTVDADVTDDAVVLSGRATAVHAAADVDWLLVRASSATGPVLVLVDAATSERVARRSLDETRGWYDVVLDAVRVPLTHLVDVGADAVRMVTDAATVLVCADALGVGERLLEMTVEHVTVREQFGRPLGSFQSVKHKAADMLMTLRGARAATYYAALALDAGAPDASLAVSIAKSFTGEGISAVAGEALQTHGGVGFTWEHDLHLYLRRAKVDELLFGSTAEHRERIVTLIE